MISFKLEPQLWSKALSIIAFANLALLILAPLATKINLLPYHISLQLVVLALGVAMLLIILLPLAFFAWSDAAINKQALVAGFIISLLIFVWLGQKVLLVKTLPVIHDISTDLNEPPKFNKIVAIRDAQKKINSLARTTPNLARKQLQAYPCVKPINTNYASTIAFENALSIAKMSGWELLNIDNQAGFIEASDSTFWFGFTDDIVIRIQSLDVAPDGAPDAPPGVRSRIDIRSVSRVGRSDLGQNADRICSFLATWHKNFPETKQN